MDELVKYDLQINSFSAFESSRDGVWNPPPRCKDYDLLIFTTGAGTCLVNGGKYALSANDVLLLRRGDRIEKAFTAGRMANLFVHFDFLGQDGRPTDPPAAILPPRRPLAVNSTVITHLTHTLMEICFKGEKASATTLLRAILVLLADHQETPVLKFHAAHHRSVVGALVERILNHPEENTSVVALAAEAGISPVQFTRLFRRHTGHPPGEFMVLARVERARLLLSTTSRTLQDIADSLGYSDISYFNRQFARKTGVPPAAYRTGRRPPVPR